MFNILKLFFFFLLKTDVIHNWDRTFIKQRGRGGKPIILPLRINQIKISVFSLPTLKENSFVDMKFMCHK